VAVGEEAIARMRDTVADRLAHHLIDGAVDPTFTGADIAARRRQIDRAFASVDAATALVALGERWMGWMWVVRVVATGQRDRGGRVPVTIDTLRALAATPDAPPWATRLIDEVRRGES